MSTQVQASDMDVSATRLSTIITEVLNRVSNHLPPMTPDIVDKIALLLNVDSKQEFFLTRVRKKILLTRVRRRILN
jgi:hypothetical protein